MKKVEKKPNMEKLINDIIDLAAEHGIDIEAVKCIKLDEEDSKSFEEFVEDLCDCDGDCDDCDGCDDEPEEDELSGLSETFKAFCPQNVRELPGGVVEVTYLDNTKEKAICLEEDTYDLRRGIEVCFLHKLFGGSAEYNKFFNACEHAYYAKEAAMKKLREEAAAREKAAAKEKERKLKEAAKKKQAKKAAEKKKDYSEMSTIDELVKQIIEKLYS